MRAVGRARDAQCARAPDRHGAPSRGQRRWSTLGGSCLEDRSARGSISCPAPAVTENQASSATWCMISLGASILGDDRNAETGENDDDENNRTATAIRPAPKLARSDARAGDARPQTRPTATTDDMSDSAMESAQASTSVIRCGE